MRFFCKIFNTSLLVQGVRWNPSSQSILDKSFRFIERFFSFLIDGYIVNSNSARELLKSISINKVELIYNGISNFQNKNQAVSTKKYVITLANLSRRKGYIEYLEVINNVVEEIPNAHFLFLGHDNLNGKVQQIIKDHSLSSNVKYIGFQSNVSNYLSESCIFVLPSLYGEGCPTSILEAFSHKLPVIAYHIDGIPELVSHNYDGVLQYDTYYGEKLGLLKRQVLTSSNVGGTWLCELNGGLNYQIEHHLFPRIHHSHYPKIAPVVKAFCEKHRIRYTHFPSIRANVWSCMEHLTNMGVCTFYTTEKENEKEKED